MPKKSNATKRKATRNLISQSSLQKLRHGELEAVHLTLQSKSGDVRLKFEPYADEGPPWVKMSIAMDEKTTLEAIKSHWPAIQKNRQALQKFQGPWTLSDRTMYILGLYHERKLGRKGYGTLAKDCNREIENLLREEYAEGRESLGERLAIDMMVALGIDGKSAREYCEDALEEIRLGKAPIWACGKNPYTQPITLEQVRKRIEWYRRTYQSKKHLRKSSCL